MQEIARRSHAACHSFLTVRRATCDWARRSTALVFTRTSRTQFRSRGMPAFGNSGRPPRIAIDVPSASCGFEALAEILELGSPGLRFTGTDSTLMGVSLRL